jgi:hypothetical protein
VFGIVRSRFPKCTQDKSNDRCHSQRRHRLFCDRLFNCGLDLPCNSLDALAGFMSLFGDRVCRAFNTLSDFAELIGGHVLQVSFYISGFICVI